MECVCNWVRRWRECVIGCGGGCVIGWGGGVGVCVSELGSLRITILLFYFYVWFSESLVG